MSGGADVTDEDARHAAALLTAAAGALDADERVTTALAGATQALRDGAGALTRAEAAEAARACRMTRDALAEGELTAPGAERVAARLSGAAAALDAVGEAPPIPG